MSKKLWLYAVVYSMVVLSAHASDDVYVDLSVLDAIPQDSIGFVQSAPLFPEVKVDTSKKIHKKTLEKKRHISKKSKVNNRKNNKKIATPTVVKDNTTKKVEVVKTPSEITSAQVEVTDNGVEVIEKTENTISVETSNDTIAVQKDENVNENNTIEEPTSVVENKKEELNSSADVTDKKEEALPQQDENKDVVAEVATDSATTTQVVNDTVAQDDSQLSKEVLSAKVSDEDMIQNTESAPKEVFSVPFSADLTELSPEAKANIDRAIQEFDAEKNKKIYIKAYNYNNGEDVFRKKRISLNRATEVRSYLLSKGFKNFSIKIINTNHENEYKNTVEIEEIN